MRSILTAVAVFIGTISTDASGEVTSAAEGGFSLFHEVTIDVSRDATWRAAVDEIGSWWSDDHTISGAADAMTIEAVPLGCFCEAIGEGGGVVHLMVTFVNPEIMLRMTGGLGPLGLMGVDGNMTWEFFDADDGTRVRFAYAVGGYHPDGLDSISGPVDFVIGEALQRLKAYVETGDADGVNAD